VGGPAHGVAVIGCDYASSSLALLEPVAGDLVTEGLLHSGSATPGLSVALSGDVVLPSASPVGDALVLIDRYPAGVLTFLAPTTGEVLGQLPVARGFAANPQDVLAWSPSRAFVSRYEANPDPQAAPGERGDDLLVIDPGRREVLGRVDLAPLLASVGSEGVQARPGRLARAGGSLWVALGHLSRRFDVAGDALIGQVDPEAGVALRALVVPGVANCTSIAAVDDEHLVAACCGLVQEGRAAQIARSALLAIDAPTDGPPSARVLRRADATPGGPFGFDLQVAGGRWLLAVRWGDLQAGEPDRLVAQDLQDPDADLVEVHVASGAFGLGGVLADDARRRLYVGDADPVDPRVYVYGVTATGFTAERAILTHPSSGLPPRSLGLY